MFLAHLPAGYLISHALLHTSRLKPLNVRPYLALGMAGSIAPDADLLWHAWFDPQPVFHHFYWTHYPFFWAVVMLPLLLACLTLGRRAWALGLLLFAVNGVGHLVLDTVWGSIGWGWPFEPKLIRWVTVGPRPGPWPLKFLLHWTALLEAAIIICAGALWWLRHRRARALRALPSPASSSPHRQESCARRERRTAPSAGRPRESGTASRAAPAP